MFIVGNIHVVAFLHELVEIYMFINKHTLMYVLEVHLLLGFLHVKFFLLLMGRNIKAIVVHYFHLCYVIIS